MGLVLRSQAEKYEISFEELQKLAEGKACPVYGDTEPLHVRHTRGGKVTVFNISDRARSEAISATKTLRKSGLNGTRSTEAIAAKSN